MIASQVMNVKIEIMCVIGPTASGKTSRSIAEAKAHNGEIISVDSRQVYSGLDIGTEKATLDERAGIPHYLIDVRNPEERYSAGDFVEDATKLIKDIYARGKLPILAGGTHFYFDALLNGLPENTPENPDLRKKLERLSNEEIYARVSEADARRALDLDSNNRRRLIRALEIIDKLGAVPKRESSHENNFIPEWIVINPPKEILRERIDTRLKETMARGLIDEVRNIQKRVGDERLNELGLEYRVIGEYLRGERKEETIIPTLSAKLWQYARHQKTWLRKLAKENSLL